jgi:hypothetical protein
MVGNTWQLMNVKKLTVGLAREDNLSAEREKGSDCFLWVLGQVALGHRVLMLPVMVLCKGLDMLPFPMRRVVGAIDGAIQMLPVPMMCKSAFLDLRPAEVNVAPINQDYR